MSSLNIYSRKDGRFEGRVYLGRSENGKRRYKSYYGATAEEVRNKHEMAQLSVIPNVTAAKMTVGVLAQNGCCRYGTASRNQRLPIIA